MSKSKSVQVANTPTGEYDVRKPLPHPYHVDEDGLVLRQDFWKGSPLRLLGFQRKRDEQVVDIFAEDWLSTDEPAPEGWYPVFMDSDGGMWNHAYPVSKS